VLLGAFVFKDKQFPPIFIFFLLGLMFLNLQVAWDYMIMIFTELHLAFFSAKFDDICVKLKTFDWAFIFHQLVKTVLL